MKVISVNSNFATTPTKDPINIAHLALAIQEKPVIFTISEDTELTGSLVSLTHKIERKDYDYAHELELIFRPIYNKITQSSKRTDLEGVQTKLSQCREKLENLFYGIFLIKEISPRSSALIRIFSSIINSLFFRNYLVNLEPNPRYINSEEDALITLSKDIYQPHPLYNKEVTQKDVRKYFLENKFDTYLIPGTIAKTATNVPASLGDYGAEYAAFILGSILEADRLEIWTENEGIMSADPGHVCDSFVIPRLHFNEAMEMAYFGATVLHPKTMLPNMDKRIPVYIKNILNLQSLGTEIVFDDVPSLYAIKGIASIEDIVIINIEGNGMIGTPGIASRVFQSLGKAQINVIMISQASSEHSICVACKKKEKDRAIHCLKQDLAADIKACTISKIDFVDDLVIIAVIGDNMIGQPGLAGKVFNSLGGARVNILAIAQGSSERNISFIVSRVNLPSALNTLHRTFFRK